MNNRNAIHTLTSAVLLGLASMSVQAQEQATTSDGTDPAAQPQAKARADATDLDRVIVTVERREEDLQKYAGTAQSLTADDLRGLGINNELRNLQVAVPGLSIANQEGNVEIYLRGVGSANNTELGDPASAPHINGVYIPRARGLGGMFYDLERVEVNKGPQGTLRGRNALGGTINIITKRPVVGGDFSGYVQAEAGNFDQRGAEFGVDLPVGEWAGLRFSGFKVEKDSSFQNAGFSGKQPAGIQDDKGGRLSFVYQPDDKLSVFLMADFGKEQGTGYPGANIYSAVCSSPVTCGGRPGNSPDDLDLRKVIYRGPQGKLDSTNWGLMTNLAYDFGPVTLAYDGSWRKVDFNQRNASSNGIAYPGRNFEPVSPTNPGGEDYDNFSTQYWLQTSDAKIHELRLFSSDPDERLHWSTGLFHFEEDQTSGFFSMVDKGIFYSGTEFTMPIVRGKSSAAYADGTFDFTDRFRMKAGIRYTEEDKYRYGIGGNWVLGLGSEGFGCCFNTRLGTEGFEPAFTKRPNFDVTGLSGNADYAQFLLQGILNNGARDTIFEQLAGIADGSRPNGTCFQRPDIDGNGSQVCPPNGQFSFLNLGIPGQQIGRSDFSYSDGRLGFEYDVRPDNLIYGTVSTGHKAGGFNDSFDANVIPETYDPESIIAYEFGSKNAFRMFGRQSVLNLSAFYYDYSDQVFQDLSVIGTNPTTGEPTGFALVNRNIGSSRLYGLELESKTRLPYGFSVDLNALYLKTKIEDGVVADARSQNFGAGGITSQIDLSGNELPLSSRLTAALRVQQTLEFGAGSFDWQVLASYRSSFFLTQFNNRDVVFVSDVLGTVDRVEDSATAGFPDQQSGETTLNAGLGFTTLSGTWRFEAWGSNLLNNDVSQKELAGNGLNLRFLNDARSYGVRARYNF